MPSQGASRRDGGPLVGWLLFVPILVVVAVACSGRDAGEAEPRMFSSDDGMLHVEIPVGAAPADTDIRIEVLSEADWPEELAGARPIGEVYDLRPTGLSFSKPVTITRRIDAT